MNRLVALCVASLLLACGGSKPEQKPDESPSAPAEKAPAATDFKAMLAREKPAMALQSVASTEGGFTAAVEGAGPPTVKQIAPAVTSVSVPIGSGTPVVCNVYAQDIDGAGSIRGIIHEVKDRVEPRSVRVVDIDVVRTSPTLAVEMDYTVMQNGRKAAGRLKLTSWSNDGLGVICMHDEMGYRKTLQRIMRGFIETLTVQDAPEPPRYVEVHVVRINGNPMGYERVSLANGEHGRTIYTSTEASFINRGGADFIASDDLRVEVTEADGALVSLVAVKASGGEVELRMTLERVPAGGFTYAGVVSGKDLKGELPLAEGQPLSSNVRMMRQLVSVADGGSAEQKASYYVASVSPTAPVPVTLRKGAAPRQVLFNLQDKEMTMVVDGAGLVERSELLIGSATLSTERIFTLGKP